MSEPYPDDTQSETLRQAVTAMQADPGNVDRQVDYAHHLLVAGQVEQAIVVARAARVTAPNHFRTLRFLSSALAVAGDADGSVRAAEEAVRTDPADAEVRIHLAGMLVGLQRPRAAVPHLMVVTEGATQAGAVTAHAWRLLSTALTELGRPERAIGAIDRAIALSPNAIEFRAHRASLLIVQGLHQEALDELAVALQQAPEDGALWRTRSGVLEVLEQSAEALADAERAVALKPDDAEFRSHLAFLRLQAGLSETGLLPRLTPMEAESDRESLSTDQLQARAEAWTALPASRARTRPAPPTGLGGALRLQGRVVRSLMLRDMRTRFGRSRLGYFGAVMEPIGHLLTLGSVFAFLNHGHPPLGTDLYIFYVTGLIPFLMFSHVVVEMMPVLTSSVAVLSLPIVKQIDVMIAKAVLALATDAFVAIVVFGGFLLLGRPGMPHDLLTCMTALAALWLLALGFGMVNLIIAELFHTWEAVISAVLRLMYFASGIYYSPLLMPAWVRDILVWNPVLQGVEWFRSGFFEQYDPHWLDRGYLFTWIGGTLVVGFALERVLRRRLVVFG